MDTDEFTKLFSDLCTANLPGQQQRVQLSVKGLNAQDAKNGTFRAGSHYIKIFSLLETELASRASEISENARRTCDSLGVDSDSDVSKFLKDSVAHQIDSSVPELKVIFDREIVTDKQQHFAFQDMCAVIIAKSNAEIALYAASLKKRSQENISTNNNYYGPVGAVLHGQASTAVVTQHIGSAESEKITAALAEILNEIRQAGNVDARTQGEMVELVQGGEEIIRAEKPNRFKISGFIAGLKNVVEIVPKAKEASEIIIAAVQALLR